MQSRTPEQLPQEVVVESLTPENARQLIRWIRKRFITIGVRKIFEVAYVSVFGHMNEEVVRADALSFAVSDDVPDYVLIFLHNQVYPKIVHQGMGRRTARRRTLYLVIGPRSIRIKRARPSATIYVLDEWRKPPKRP